MPQDLGCHATNGSEVCAVVPIGICEIRDCDNTRNNENASHLSLPARQPPHNTLQFGQNEVDALGPLRLVAARRSTGSGLSTLSAFRLSKRCGPLACGSLRVWTGPRSWTIWRSPSATSRKPKCISPSSVKTSRPWSDWPRYVGRKGGVASIRGFAGHARCGP